MFERTVADKNISLSFNRDVIFIVFHFHKSFSNTLSIISMITVLSSMNMEIPNERWKGGKNGKYRFR